MRIDAVIDALFQIAIRFINDDGLAFASTVYSIILVFHALLGAGELLTGKDCRFISPNFWLRLLFFGFLIAGFDTVIVPFAKTVAKLGFDQFADSYVQSWKAWSTTSQNMISNAQQQGNSNAGVLSFINSTASYILESILSGIGLLLTFIISGLLMLLTFIMGIVGVGLSVAVCAMGPIALVFGVHESTEGIALNYLKAFLVYCVFYLPMLALAMEIAITLQVAINTMTTGLGYGNAIGGFTEHLFLLVTAPLAAFALVFTVPMTASSVLK